MTLQECIEAIEAVNMDNHPITVFENLFETVKDYDYGLACELTEDYHYEDYVIDAIHEMNDIQDIQEAVESLNSDYGIYYDDGWGSFEDADLDRLKYDILDALRDREDDENEKPEDESVNNNEENWVEEDDDFLTKEVK